MVFSDMFLFENIPCNNNLFSNHHLVIEKQYYFLFCTYIVLYILYIMSSAGTLRASRASTVKEKPVKLQNPITKTGGQPQQIQATAEQMRIAQMISDGTDSEDPQLKEKIKQVMELTGKSNEDAIIVALHDCDNDLNKAVNMLLEGDQDQGEWETSGKKKKNRQSAPSNRNADATNNNKEGRSERFDRSRDRDGSRSRGPPRLSRGGKSWKGRENEKNERNLEDGNIRDRSADGRGRGRQINGPGRGRGGRGGSRSRTFQSRGSNQGFPKAIDTWTNSTTDTAGTGDTSTTGKWMDNFSSEDWGAEDDWTGSVRFSLETDLKDNLSSYHGLCLAETKVFTPSVSVSSNIASINEVNVSSGTVGSQTIDLVALLEKPSVTPESLSNSTMQQQSAQYISQYNQQASETIKSAVGVGCSSSSSQQSQQSNTVSQPLSSRSPAQTTVTRTNQSSQLFSSSNNNTQSTNTGPLTQRSKVQRPKIPPPSKIPSSAVEMPGDAITKLDVQFGGLEFGSESSAFDFGTNDVTTNSYQSTSVSNNPATIANHLQQSLKNNDNTTLTPMMSNVSNNKTVMSSLEQNSALRTGYKTPTNSSTAAKDIGQPKQMSSAEILPTHKTSPLLASQRQSQSTNLDSSLSNKSDNSLNSFASHQASHTAGYQSTYQSHKPSTLNSTHQSTITTASYTHPTVSISAHQTGLSHVPQNQSQVIYGPQSTFGVHANQVSTPGYSSQSSHTQVASNYQSQSAYQSQASYTSQQNSGSVYSSTHSAGSQAQPNFGSQPSYTSSHSLHTSPISANKLNNSVKDSSLDTHTSTNQHTYDHTTNSSSNLTSTLTTANTTAAAVSVSSGLGLTAPATTMTVSGTKSLSANKAPPNLPPGVPAAMLGAQYIMSQPGLPIYGIQQPLYSYEEIQLLQQRLPPLTGYYDMPFPPATTLTGRDGGLTNVPYSSADGKFNRGDNSSPVPTTMSQQTTTQHQQFINAALPPGYGYYYPGGMVAGSFPQYGTPIFPVPQATNAHGATTSAQFQKPTAYGSHSYNSGYDELCQVQDYASAGYGGVFQNKGSTGPCSGTSGSSSGSEMPGSAYTKSHSQVGKSYDKQGFHAGTPPPFNLPLASGTQGGPMGAPSTAYAPPFIPLMAHHQQHHSAMLHHPLQQDSQGSASQRSVQNSSQQKVTATKQNYNTSYWGAN